MKQKFKKGHHTSNQKQVVFSDFYKLIRRYKPKVEKPRVIHEIDLKKSSPMDQALEIQANLTSKFPSFVKNMLPSHVTGGFWLGLPKNFTTRHLPKQDETVVLVDENDLEHDTKYLADKNGLSGGWRGFSIAHKLQEQDVLIFHLIQPCKFKVYIVRANLTETDVAISLVNLGASAKEMVHDHLKKDLKITVMGQEENLYQDYHVHNVQEKDMVALSNYADAAEKHVRMDIDNYDLDDSLGIMVSQPINDFKDVKTFENFNVIVYGYIIIDNEIPQHLRVKYYELCCSQKSYLHDQLTDGLKMELVVGVILETINIADAIRSSKLTSLENLKSWDDTLKAIEVLGMKVGFLRARINKLVTLSSDANNALNRKILEKVKAEEEFRALALKKVKVEEEIRALVLKKVKALEEVKALEDELVSVKQVIDNSDQKSEYMKRRAERLEAVFLEELKAPW
ncbi:TF-B3 domain-containing protein [Heracleum sosnowskyi]|uniref:TF-B3 domain-containing protein n=1 Tax=Heracleum sosnowskyi TaxID=360622 RepID=A0AAD8H423_9APIA|nr:TF-B3 domain-containing protein [Heracleum sosnowskyi]